MDVVAIQETHYVCDVNAIVMSNEFVVSSAYREQLSRGVSLLVKCSLDTRVGIVHLGVEGQLLMADIAMRTVSFRFVAVYTPAAHG